MNTTSSGNIMMLKKTGLPVLIAEDPLSCVVRGCGLALEHMQSRNIFAND